jgi:hypothetical protein
MHFVPSSPDITEIKSRLMIKGEFWDSHEKQLSKMAFCVAGDNILNPAVADKARVVEFRSCSGTCSSAKATNPFNELPAS